MVLISCVIVLIGIAVVCTITIFPIKEISHLVSPGTRLTTRSATTSVCRSGKPPRISLSCEARIYQRLRSSDTITIVCAVGLNGSLRGFLIEDQSDNLRETMSADQVGNAHGCALVFADSLFPITVGRRCNICLAIKLGVLVDTGVS